MGDFLAGIFAPVAFLWLILGYIQQGKQLEQNTRALEQQEQALQLQIEEMRESVRQQKELSRIQNEHLLEQRHLIAPKIFISEFKARAAFGNSISPDQRSGEYIYDNVAFISIYFNLENLGEDAYSFKVTENQNLQSLMNYDLLESQSKTEIKLSLSTQLVEKLNLNKMLEEIFTVSYECKNGVKIKKNLFINLYPQKLNSPFFYVNMYLD